MNTPQIEKLEELIKIHCVPGTINYSPHMYGMAIGLICALACMKGEDAVYPEKPAEWMENKPPYKEQQTPLTAEDFIKDHKKYITLWLHPYDPHVKMIENAMRDYADQQTAQLRQELELQDISSAAAIEMQKDDIKGLRQELEQSNKNAKDWEGTAIMWIKEADLRAAEGKKLLEQANKELKRVKNKLIEIKKQRNEGAGIIRMVVNMKELITYAPPIRLEHENEAQALEELIAEAETFLSSLDK